MVDGRNPAPADKWLIPLLKGFSTIQGAGFRKPSTVHQKSSKYWLLHMASSKWATLWWTNIAMERSTIFHGKNPLFLWPFSIAMLVHQRVQYSGNFNSTATATRSGGPVPRDRALRSWWRSKISEASSEHHPLTTCFTHFFCGSEHVNLLSWWMSLQSWFRKDPSQLLMMWKMAILVFSENIRLHR